MACLQVNLLGKPEVFLDGAPITAFDTAKSQALLFFLLVTERGHTREVLANLLWGEMDGGLAKRNLTKALTTLRRLLESHLSIERQSVDLLPGAEVRLDTALFQTTVQSGLDESPVDPERAITKLGAAVDLYRGDFMEGFYVREAETFEVWASNQREYLRELAIRALDALVDHALRLGRFETGIEYSARLLRMDPYREQAYRQLMLLYARSGQRSAALEQYETCLRLLREDLGVEPEPELTALYEQLRNPAAPPPHNLPYSPAFFGREVEMARLMACLEDPQRRLVTLFGPGGIGKTHLALEGARRCTQPESVLGFGGTAPFRDGVFWVDLSGLAESDENGLQGSQQPATSEAILTAIAGALEFTLTPASDIKRQLTGYLRDRQVLLVLDNFDPLLEGSNLLEDLLSAAPRLKLIVTSRERLGLRDEWVLEVPGLDYPPADWQPAMPPGSLAALSPVNWLSPEGWASRYGALALFLQRAAQIRGSTAVSEADLPHIVTICRLVEGVPLAIELAAAWVRVLSCAEIAAEISRGLDFLSSALRSLPERHRSLRAVFEQSWGLLTAQEKSVFRCLSIFRGGFRREAAQEIAGASLWLLAGMVDKSLLRQRDGRYYVHEMLRQYAAEKLWDEDLEEDRPGKDQPSQAEEIWEHYSRYYMGLVQSQETSLLSGQASEALDRLREDLENVRRAWRWAVNELRLEPIRRSLPALARFYDLSGLSEEGQGMFEQAAAHVRKNLPALDEEGQAQEAQAVLALLLAAAGGFG